MTGLSNPCVSVTGHGLENLASRRLELDFQLRAAARRVSGVTLLYCGNIITVWGCWVPWFGGVCTPRFARVVFPRLLICDITSPTTEYGYM